MGWKVIPLIVNLGEINALVSKLRQGEGRVQHTVWKNRQGEQGPDKNVSQFLVCQVKYPYNTGLLHPMSMSYLSEVFECLLRLRMGIWLHTHIDTTTGTSPDL